MDDLEEIKVLLRAQIHTVERLCRREETFFEMLVEKTTDHEKRIRVIERALGYSMGAVGVILFILSRLH